MNSNKNTTEFFTTNKIIAIFILLFVYIIVLNLFLQPYSKLICNNDLCTMYSKKGKLNKDVFEYSFNRSNITDYTLQKHSQTSGGGKGRHLSNSYSLLLFLSNNKRIHLPYYFSKQQADDFYYELKSNNSTVKLESGYVYKFE